MQFKDYYEVLGVGRDAGADEIKKAFRRLARKHHPDVSKLPDASSRMSEINEAHAVLADPERRAAYDAVGRGRRQGEAFTPPPNWDAGFEFSGGAAGDAGDYSDFFAELFGRAGARGRPRGPGPQKRGEDHHAKVALDLQDAWGGAVRQVSLRSPQTGVDGRVTLVTRTLDVKIPAGVKPGQRIRLAGQGAAGLAGSAAGDLFLEVQFHPHPQFKVEGVDLISELPVSPWEAALGAVVTVPLPDGASLKVRVPAGAQSGRRLTVRGKGLPTSPPGDLELVVRVLLPSASDPRAKALYEQMAHDLPEFDARAMARAEGVGP